MIMCEGSFLPSCLVPQLKTTWDWIEPSFLSNQLKPVFGLSGAVLRLDNVFPLLVRVFVPSIPTRSFLLHLLSCFSQRHIYIHLPLAAIDGDADGIARAVIVHDMAEILLILDVLTVNRDDEVASDRDRSIAEVSAFVATVQAGAVSSASRNHLHDQQPRVGCQAHLIG